MSEKSGLGRRCENSATDRLGVTRPSAELLRAFTKNDWHIPHCVLVNRTAAAESKWRVHLGRRLRRVGRRVKAVLSLRCL